MGGEHYDKNLQKLLIAIEDGLDRDKLENHLAFLKRSTYNPTIKELKKLFPERL